MDLKEDIGSIGMAEAAKIAKEFIREVIGSVKYTPENSNFDKEKNLWIITVSIKPDAIEDIDLEKIFHEGLDELLHNLTKLEASKTSGNIKLKLSFYIGSSGNIYAIVPILLDDATTEKLIKTFTFKQDENLKDNDAKYYSLIAKKYIESATTFKYFDFIPFLVFRANEEWHVTAIVTFYSKFESFVKGYNFRMSDKGIIEVKALTTEKKFEAKE